MPHTALKTLAPARAARAAFALRCLLPIILCSTATATASPIAFDGLLRELTALDRLARFPDPPYVTRQFSSYDRRSTDPAEATDENWFANHDRGEYLRTEERNGETEYVLMDAEGPGAIVRIWSANPNDAGILRIYIDHAEDPVIEMPMDRMLGGGEHPFIAPIAGVRGRGWNSYLPIPYASHCKVTSSAPDFYYHINYRTYDDGVKVEPFSMDAVREHDALLKEQAGRLLQPWLRSIPDDLRDVQHYGGRIAPGETYEFVVHGHDSAIYRIAGNIASGNVEAALRGCLLTVAFDQEPPAIVAPLGDFFGTAPGLNTYHGLPLGVREDGTFYCNFTMPFRRAATFRIENHSAYEARVRFEIASAAFPWDRDTLYFHAKWRAELGIPTMPRQDWNYLDVQGRGRFAGAALAIANPVPDWWGEGDEKIYLDNESFPSTFGTGTEDYFGYAWCDTQVFSHAFHNQPRADGPANFGHVSNNRFHIIDDMPFRSAFRFDMELWHWNLETQVDQAVTAYWYAAPGAADAFEKPDPELLIVPELPELPGGVEGAIEGEAMRVIRTTGGNAIHQSSGAWNWSRMMQLWWIDPAPGDVLELGFQVERAGRYEVRAVFTKAPDYGIHRIAINGESAGEHDFYAPEVHAAAPVSLGVFDLNAGENRLRVEAAGAHPSAEPRHMFGLDYLLIEPAAG